MFSHIKCAPCHYSIERPQVADIEGSTKYNNWKVVDSRQGMRLLSWELGGAKNILER